MSARDIARYTKIMEYKLLSDLIRMLDDPMSAMAKAGIDQTVHWGVFTEDKKRNLTARLHKLHTLLTALDPSGRKMMPPPSSQK